MWYSLFPVTRDFTWLPWLFKYHQVWLSDYNQSTSSGLMHLIETHRLVDIQVPRTDMSLTLAYSRRGITPSHSTFWIIHSRALCRAVVSKDWDKKNCWITQPSTCPLLLGCLCCTLGRACPPGLSNPRLELWNIMFMCHNFSILCN